MDIDPTAITLAILAGGQGTRMGKPKAYLTLAGQPILEHLLSHFSWPGPTLLVTAPGLERPPGHDRFTAEVTDPTANEGPLRGLLTALEGCRLTGTATLVVTTVDMPALRSDHLFWLAAQLAERPTALGVMPVGAGDRLEPFPCAVRAAAAEAVSQQLQAGEWAVHKLARHQFVAVPVPPDWDAAAWTNLNHPQELQAYLDEHPPRQS